MRASREKWRTRTQKIRTVPPLYQRVARKSVHLKQLGLSLTAIALKLGVTDKTVAKAISWLKAVTHNWELRDAPRQSGGQSAVSSRRRSGPEAVDRASDGGI